jgi:hypothetical protein
MSSVLKTTFECRPCGVTFDSSDSTPICPECGTYKVLQLQHHYDKNGCCCCCCGWEVDLIVKGQEPASNSWVHSDTCHAVLA